VGNGIEGNAPVKLPAPLINPMRHPWWSKIANKSVMLSTRVIVPVVALPVAAYVWPQHKSWGDVIGSAAAGAAVGGAAGLYFPQLEVNEVKRMDAIREGVISGAIGAPLVAGGILFLADHYLGAILPHGLLTRLDPNCPGGVTNGTGGGTGTGTGAGTGPDTKHPDPGTNAAPAGHPPTP
jgi:hypothetical protein